MSDVVRLVKGCCFCGQVIEDPETIVRLELSGPGQRGGRMHAHIDCLRSTVTSELKAAVADLGPNDR